MALRPDLWVREHQAVEAYGNDLYHKVVLMNQQSLSGLQASRMENQIAVLLATFGKKISALQGQLEGQGESGVITAQEAKRRQRLVDALSTKKAEVENCLRNPSSNARNQLLGLGHSGAPDTRGAEPGGAQASNEPVDYRQMTKELEREQDRGLDMLSEIITRQKSLVRGIGNQIDVQNELIDDIGDNMDTTQVRLVRNTRNVERISNKSDSCCYWVIIVLLLIAIIVASVV